MWGVRPRLIGGYLSIVLLLAVSWAVAYLETVHVRESYTRSVRVDDALVDNITLRMKLLDDEETGLRGYLLTDRSRYLQPYTAAQEKLPGLRADALRLAEQTGSGLPPLVTMMTRRALAWERWARPLVTAPAARVTHAAGFIAAMDQGKHLFDRYRGAVAGVQGAVSRRRDADLAASNHAIFVMNLLLAAIFGGATVLLGGIGSLTTRMVTRPLDQLGLATEQIRSGDLDHAVTVDGPREFVVLGDTMEQMRLARKRAEEATEQARRQNEAILNSAGEGIYMVDESGRVTYINPIAAAMLGYDVEELMGKRIHPLVHHTRAVGDPYPAEECSIFAVIHENQVRRVSDEVFWRKDGSSFPVEYVATPICEGPRAVGAVCIFRDVTQRREVERLKDEFISVVSHELRTPLTSIRGSLGLLAGGVMGPIPEPAQRMLDIAESNTDRLIRLINDILDIERMQSGRVTMNRQTVEVTDVLDSALSVTRPLAEKAGLRLEVQTEAGQLSGDPDRLVQVLTNLLSNAIKFSSEGQTVRAVTRRQGAEMLFSVTDEGRGIPADKLETIFERFQQVDASDSRERGGTGLGLAIVRAIVEQHGGRIWVESTVGEGSTFYVSLPLLLEPGVSLDVAPLAPQERRPVVLICDDDSATRATVASMLEARGYRTRTAASGAAAVGEALSNRPDAVLLDLRMPGMNGWQTLAALKEQPSTADIPVVIFSAFLMDEPQGTDDVAGWVSKPVDEDALMDALGEAMRQARVTRVLVVEDDLDLARILRTMFERHGAVTYHAATGREAIGLSQQVTPDMIVLDLALPDGNGYSVVDWLRRYDRLPAVPLVVYTGSDLNHADRERLRLGPTQFFTKSRISPDEFERQVVSLLGQLAPVSVNGGRE